MRKLKVIIIIFLLIQFGFIYYRYSQKNLKITELEEQLNGHQFLEAKYSMLQNNIKFQFESEDNKLSSLFQESYKSLIEVYKSAQENPKIIFRFSDEYCQGCIDYALEKLIDFGHKIGLQNIIILTSFQYDRDLFFFKEKIIKNDTIKVINIAEHELPIPIDEIGMPYYFLLDKDNIAKMVFIPAKEIPKMTTMYFEIIREKMFSQIQPINRIKNNHIDHNH